MKRLAILGLVLLFMCSVASARDFRPQGDIVGRDTYSIVDFVNINATDMYRNGVRVATTADIVAGNGNISGAGTPGQMCYFNTGNIIKSSSSFTTNGSNFFMGRLNPTENGTFNVMGETGENILVLHNGSRISHRFFYENDSVLGHKAIIQTSDTLVLREDNNIGFMLEEDQDVLIAKDAGEVGIGLGSNLNPRAQLEIAGNGIMINDSATAGMYLYRGELIGQIDTSNAELTLRAKKTGSDISFRNSSGTENMLLSSNGNVGIGTTSPSDKLHIEGGALIVEKTGQEKFQLYSRNVTGIAVPSFSAVDDNTVVALDVFPKGNPVESGTNGYAWFDVCDTDIMETNPAMNCGRIGARSDRIEIGTRIFNGATPVPLYLGVNGQTSLVIDTSLNVGIGTATPTTKFDVSGDITIHDASPALLLEDTDNSIYAKIRVSGDDIEIFTNNDTFQPMEIRGDTGYVGINTLVPSSQLEVGGTVTATEFSGAQDWSDNQNYPAAASDGYAITALGDSVTTGRFVKGIGDTMSGILDMSDNNITGVNCLVGTGGGKICLV